MLPATATPERVSLPGSTDAYIKLVEESRNALRLFTSLSTSNTPVSRVALEELVNTTVCSIVSSTIITFYKAFRFDFFNSTQKIFIFLTSRRSRLLYVSQLMLSPVGSASPNARSNMLVWLN
jgi:hypothetical protein